MENKNGNLRNPAINYAWLRVLLFLIGFGMATTIIQGIGIIILMVAKTDFKVDDFKSFISDTENFNYMLLFKFWVYWQFFSQFGCSENLLTGNLLCHWGFLPKRKVKT